MDLRKAVGKNPELFAAAACGAILVSLGFIILQGKKAGAPPLPYFPGQAFYTADDGATLFKDDVNLIPPFDHGGATAVRAHVFTCDGGQHRWVQFLEKYNDEDKKRLESGRNDGTFPPPDRLVKQPGPDSWVSERSPQGKAITTPHCSDGLGSGPPQMVMP